MTPEEAKEIARKALLDAYGKDTKSAWTTVQLDSVAQAIMDAAPFAIRDFALGAACQEHGQGSMAFHCSECGKRWQVASRRAAKEAGWSEALKKCGVSEQDCPNPYKQEGGS